MRSIALAIRYFYASSLRESRILSESPRDHQAVRSENYYIFLLGFISHKSRAERILDVTRNGKLRYNILISDRILLLRAMTK